jgi:hypothetical protein
MYIYFTLLYIIPEIRKKYFLWFVLHRGKFWTYTGFSATRCLEETGWYDQTDCYAKLHIRRTRAEKFALQFLNQILHYVISVYPYPLYVLGSRVSS